MYFKECYLIFDWDYSCGLHGLPFYYSSWIYSAYNLPPFNLFCFLMLSSSKHVINSFYSSLAETLTQREQALYSRTMAYLFCRILASDLALFRMISASDSASRRVVFASVISRGRSFLATWKIRHILLYSWKWVKVTKLILFTKVWNSKNVIDESSFIRDICFLL